MFRVLVVVLSLLAFAPAASAQTFGVQTSFKWAPGGNYRALTGDFDGDGMLDIGLRDTNNGVFYLRFGPSFGKETTVAWASGTNFQPFAADMNGDGKTDVGLRSISDGTIYWRYGPDFTVQSTFAWTGGSQYWPLAADFTGDGKADLALRGSDTGTIWIRRSPGFTSEYTFAGPAGGAYEPFAADFNADARADLGLAFGGDNTFFIRFGPDFATQFTFLWAAGNDYQPFAGDLNRDGRADLGVREISSGYFNIRPQDVPVQATPTPAPSPAAAKDLDGDHVEAPLDCDDANAAIRPGAPDAPGDGIDQDCSGADAPLPALKARAGFGWGFLKRDTVLTKIELTDLSGGETVTITCAGKAKGCPRKGKRYTNLKAGRRVFGSPFGRRHRLRTGAKVTVTLSKPGTIGTTATLTVRKRRQAPRIARA